MLNTQTFTNINNHLYTAIAIYSLLFITACTSTHNKEKPNNLKYLDHPLVGKIWDVENQKLISQAKLLSELESGDYLLLGESHDNIRHHQYQALVIESIAKSKSNIGIAFEMIDDKQGGLLKSTPTKSSAELINVLNKEKTGWEYNKYYKLIFDRAIESGLGIYPANINRDSLISIISKGEDKIPSELKQQIDANPLSKPQKEALKKQIIESHCGMANVQMIKGMTLGQQVRDAAITNSILNIQKDTVILIAGSGHVRKDRGVPKYIAKHDANAKIISVAWLEVTDELHEIENYSTYWDSDTFPFDYVWFTPASDRPDPCKEMKKHMEKMKKQHTKPESGTNKKMSDAELRKQAI